MTTTRTAVLARSASTFRVTMKNIPVRSLKRVCGLGWVPSCLLGAEGIGAQTVVLSLYSGVRNDLFSSMIHSKGFKVHICIPDSPIVQQCGQRILQTSNEILFTPVLEKIKSVKTGCLTFIANHVQ